MLWFILFCAVAVIVYIYRDSIFPKPKDPDACPRCDGRGYFEALRGREPCGLCKGTGRRS